MIKENSAKLSASVIITLCICFSCAQKQPGKTTAPKQVVDSLKYIPKATGWVNDYNRLFDTNEIKVLDSIIGDYEKRSSVEISVATVDSSITGPIDLQAYSMLMAKTWGIGKKDKNNGILIVIAADARRIRIQNGYGIEEFLSNKETKEIIDFGIIPYFKEDKFYLGTKNGVLAIIKRLDKNGYK